MRSTCSRRAADLNEHHGLLCYAERQGPSSWGRLFVLRSSIAICPAERHDRLFCRTAGR